MKKLIFRRTYFLGDWSHLLVCFNCDCICCRRIIWLYQSSYHKLLSAKRLSFVSILIYLPGFFYIAWSRKLILWLFILITINIVFYYVSLLFYYNCRKSMRISRVIDKIWYSSCWDIIEYFVCLGTLHWKLGGPPGNPQNFSVSYFLFQAFIRICILLS